MMARLDALEARIVNALQSGFALSRRPYLDAAARLGIGEDELLGRLRSLLERGVLSRFGPLYQVERMGGIFVLASMQVPEADFDRVAQALGDMTEVAHNYRREHRFNMWFVLAAESAEAIDQALARIERIAGVPVLVLPKEREYRIGMRLEAVESTDAA
jgi:DNA-binding Lrp family transcriptional regulator